MLTGPSNITSSTVSTLDVPKLASTSIPHEIKKIEALIYNVASSINNMNVDISATEANLVKRILDTITGGGNITT